MTAEHQRLKVNNEKPVPLEQWGPYLSERQWGTVREDYGVYGDAWGYLPFDQSHYRAYRWGEDGIAGISDYFQNLCFAITLWNGKDKILKEYANSKHEIYNDIERQQVLADLKDYLGKI